MIRHAAAIAIVVCLSPSWLCAESTEFTVSAVRADVHKSPSTGSPIIAKASRGTVLRVRRELGSWVRISWPGAEDGVGYVHVSMGWISHISLPGSNQTAPVTLSAPPAPESASPTTTVVQASRTEAVQQPPSVGPVLLTPATHLVGLGGRMGGSTLGFGVSARASVGHRFGIQLEVSRYAPSSAVSPQRLTSIQFAPDLLYSLPDKLTDYVWLRPYLGAGVTSYRSTLRGGTPGGASVTDSRLGRQVFGGTEVTFASAPRFTLSADYGYRWPQAPFDGFELGGRGLSVSGHWYVK
jgi:hypothetical protein